MGEGKDIILFLYKEEDRSQKKFLELFKGVTKRLEKNGNILVLRCNVSKNEMTDKLGYEVKVTPWIMFFRHRMKDHPIHYQQPVISEPNVIEFIMENTTFDWVDEDGAEL